MITTPFTRVYPNTQDGVVDCNEPVLTYTSGDVTIGFEPAADTFFFHCTDSPSVALHVNVDKEGTIPMVVQEQGYEWTPVYTRKLT